MKFKLMLVVMILSSVSSCGGGGGASSVTQALYGIAYDATNNKLFVSDNNLNLIQSVNTTSGTLTSVAGGSITTAQLSSPSFMLAVPNGLNTDLFVADSGNEVIRKIASANGTPTVTTYAGVVGASGNVDGNIDSGVAPFGTFFYPNAIAVDGAGNYFIADTGNRAIREITGGVVSQIAGISSGFGSPAGIAIDANNVMYVTDAQYNIIKAVFYGTAHAPGGCSSTANVWNVCTLAGISGTAGYLNNTAGNTSAFHQPQGIATAGLYVYVADSANNAIRQVTISTGATTTLAGSTSGKAGKTDDLATDNGVTAKFSFPTGLVYDGSRYLYVVDQSGSSIRKVDTQSGNTSTIY